MQIQARDIDIVWNSIQSNLPRQTGQVGCSAELETELCACSIDPVYCTSTVKRM